MRKWRILQSSTKRWTLFAKHYPGRARQKFHATYLIVELSVLLSERMPCHKYSNITCRGERSKVLSEQSAESHRNRTSGIANYGSSGGGDLITKSAKLPSWQRERGWERCQEGSSWFQSEGTWWQWLLKPQGTIQLTLEKVPEKKNMLFRNTSISLRVTLTPQSTYWILPRDSNEARRGRGEMFSARTRRGVRTCASSKLVVAATVAVTEPSY